MKASRVAAKITLSLDTCISDDQQSFFANALNKADFIQLLSSCLHNEGFIIIQADADADTDIVATALREAACQKSVAVAADDTDILILLVHHLKDYMNDIVLVSQNRNKVTKQCNQVSIHEVQRAVGRQVSRQLLAIHAIGGCDTTSAVFGIGKETILKRLTAGMQFVGCTDTLQNHLATVDEVVSSGLQLMIGLYGGKTDQSINKL